MPRPLLSIVTPSFNQAGFLRQALESVLSQDYPEIESIVVDGGSTDGSLAILESFGDRVRWVSERDRGQAHAINKGFKMARGEIVAWINSDDLLLPGAAALAAEAFQTRPDLGLVHGEGLLIDETGARIDRFRQAEPFNLWRLIHFGDTILQQSVFMSRAAVEAVGGLDESLNWGMDWDLFLKLGKRFRTRFIPTEMGAIRVYGDTKTATGGWNRVQELGRVIERHGGRRRTPSYWGFALDALQGAARRGAKRLGPLASPAARALDSAEIILAGRILPRMQECQGWFEDGWASPHVDVLLPALAGASALLIEGESTVADQTLDVRVDGVKLLSRELGRGPFQVRHVWPFWAAGSAPAHIALDAGRVVEISPRPVHRGTRNRAYKLSRVAICDPAGEVECVTPRWTL